MSLFNRTTAAAVAPGTPRISRRTQQVARSSFSVDSIVQDRFRKMIRFKRVMTTVGLLEAECNLTDRDAVDELVYFFELMEQNTSRNTWKPTSQLPKQSTMPKSSALKAPKRTTAMQRFKGLTGGDNMV
eukprot:TRINITY_DN6808_c0_g1_i1.p2 TRINITY_DN6808_c0_g1~~TRINITY_DN6808_c0_g1_i1.p2  ORF type:complete len:129 (+),score=26.28 TRINITY_DN6808_c0_g1_i1:76-462(+)